MRNFRSNQNGIVVGMVVMLATIILIGIAWVVTTPVVGLFWNAITPQMPTEHLGILDTLNNTFAWTFLILIIGMLAYGAALSFKKDPVDVEGY